MRIFVAILCTLLTAFAFSNCGSSEKKEEKYEGVAGTSGSPDLQLFGLRGKVKQLKDETGTTYKFTDNGSLETDKGMVVERDTASRITKIRTNKRETDYTWDSEGQLAGSSYAGITMTYSYDDRGYPLTCKTVADTWELCVYRYLEFDEQHNWVKRECHSVGVKAEAETGEETSYDNTEIQQRKIEYY